MLHFLFKWEGQILWSNMIELLYFGISRKAMDTPFPMLILPRENHEGINIQTLICREGVQEQGGNCCGTCNKLSFFISISDMCIWNLTILHISTLILNVLACEIVGAVCLTEYCWALYQNFELTSQYHAGNGILGTTGRLSSFCKCTSYTKWGPLPFSKRMELWWIFRRKKKVTKGTACRPHLCSTVYEGSPYTSQHHHYYCKVGDWVMSHWVRNRPGIGLDFYLVWEASDQLWRFFVCSFGVAVTM